MANKWTQRPWFNPTLKQSIFPILALQTGEEKQNNATFGWEHRQTHYPKIFYEGSD